MERSAVNPSDVKARSGAGVAGVDRLIEVDIAANATIDMQVVRADGMSLAHGSGAPPLSLRANAVLDDFLRRDLLEHNMAARLPPAPNCAGARTGRSRFGGRQCGGVRRLPVAEFDALCAELRAFTIALPL